MFTGRVGHLDGVESPWGNAGGVVKAIEDVEQMSRTGVGWIEAGSYTLEPRKGNAWNPETEQFDRRVYHHNPDTGETFNSLGMPNKGMDLVEMEIPEMAKIAHAHNKPLAVNVAPVSEEPEAESVELITRAYGAGADTVILNAGCPNVVMDDGKRHELLSRNPSSFVNTLHGIAEAAIGKPIWVRISPQETYQNANTICFAMWASRCVSAILTPNTWPGRRPTDSNDNPILDVPGGLGGRSGPATAEDTISETANAVMAIRKTKIDVVRSGGIVNATELYSSLKVGAVAAAGTTFFYESRNGWKEDTDRLLSELATDRLLSELATDNS